MKIKQLLKDVIAVEHIEKPIASTSIIIPDSATSSTQAVPVTAIVKLVGTKCKLPLKPGDKVLVPYHLGNRTKTDNGTVIFYDSEDVLAIVESSK